MDVAKLWDMLDDEQRADFEKALADGRLGNMVNLWTPWWAPGEVCCRCCCASSWLMRFMPLAPYNMSAAMPCAVAHQLAHAFSSL